MDLQSALERIFKLHPDQGTYLHIGANDGITDNPTYPLYQRGWSGVCVEPLAKYFDRGVAERKRDRWIKGVVVDKSYPKPRTPFWVDPSGRFAGLENWEDLAKQYWDAENPDESFPGMAKKSLKAIKVNDDVPRGRFAGGLDVLLIDVNGCELEVLSTIDLGLWKPRIVVVPAGWNRKAAMMDAYMNLMGYYHLAPGKVDDWYLYSNSLRDTHAL